MLEKRKKYGELVKTFFPPTPDPLKQRELELIKERSTKIYPKTTKSESPPPFRPKKFRPNPMLPPAKTPRTSSPIDFLAEQRKIRENYEFDRLLTEPAVRTVDWEKELRKDGKSQVEIAKSVCAKAGWMEKEAQRKGLYLSHVNPANTRGIEVGEQVDQAVIESIRAKLSIITDAD